MRQSPPEVVTVAVWSSDAVMSRGAVEVFGRCPRTRVLPESSRADADVLVAVEPVIGAVTMRWLREVRGERARPPKTVLVTDELCERDVLAAVECGLAAVLPLTGLAIPELIRTVLAVRSGDGMLPPHVQGTLLAHLQRMRRYLLEPNNFTMSGLTTREQDVLELVAEGLNIDEIAAKLSCSARTVKTALYGFMERYQLRSRTHAVAFVIRAGII